MIEFDEEARSFVASWDEPGGGGISTQASDLAELQRNVSEAVRCHFEAGETPESIRLHFLVDPVLRAA